MRLAVTGMIIASAVAAPTAAAGQLPVDSLHLAVGFGVDTAGSPEHDVFALWRRYLSEPSDSLRATLWSERERAQWPYFDLVAPYVYQGFSHFTVVSLAPAVGLPDTYLIRTLVASVDDSTHDVRPLAMYRVYAVREDGRWVLANALPRMTRTWQHRSFRQVTFVYPETYRLLRRRAAATAAFVDSLAHAFGLPEPGPITYYFTADLGETLRALGLEFFPLGADTVGGRSNVGTRQVYVGSSANGEGYRHELAHIVLSLETRGSAGLLAEGLMTWTGGSAGLDYAQLLPGLARYVAEHPDLTLLGIMQSPPTRVGSLDVGYDGMALLCKLVFDGSGLPGLRALLSAGTEPERVLDTAAQRLGVSRQGLDSLWRARALAR